MPPTAQWFNLLRHFALRDFRQRWLGSFSGGLWAIVQPLLLLGIYAVVFVQVMKMPWPDSVGVGFVPFLAAGLWPWMAFAEGINRGIQAIPEHASLLAKVPLPREVLVLAPVATSFVVHGIGYGAALIALGAMGQPIQAAGAPVALFGFIVLFAFAAGLALLLAALNVFVRDLAQVVTQLLTLLFFLTPVFYARQMVPARLAQWLDWNPLALLIDRVRAPLLAQDPAGSAIQALLIAAVAVALGLWVFRRLSRHFEDFL
jgi:ABC-type polysaccharide/polyol phosphate export permease